MIRIIDHEGNGYGAQAEITRRKGVNGEKSLTGVIYTNDEVLHGVDRGWKLEFENEMYAFTFALPKDTGNRIELEFDAVHEFFFDMSKSAQNNLLNDGSHTFRAYLDFIFSDTPYNYSLDVSVSAFERQSFGQRNRLDLFYDVINTAGVEFRVNGYVVSIVEKIGNDLSTIVKKGFNLNELRLEKNIGNFVTYQKGFGAWNDEEDHSKGRLEVEYLSPLAEIYGKLDADPIVDERYSVSGNLLNRLKNNVEGSYQISVQINMEDLTRAGYEYKQPHEGDSIMAINNDLGFQRKVRIVSYETDFDIVGNILDHRIMCNSVGMVEQSISSTNNIKYAIKELQTDLELARQQITVAQLSADGKSMNYYGPVEPTETEYKLSIGDTWFDTSGETTVTKVWNGVEWRRTGVDVEALNRQFQEIEQEIVEAKQTADEAVGQINTAVANAGFTSLDETISSVQTISNQAQINSGTAINNALEAMQQASQAIDNTGSLNIRVDEVENTLSLTADKQTVADLIGVVDSQALDIQANAQGLALKANQSTVDTLAGTVQTLGTEFDIVAGQVNSRVWNTDIETAIDGIEVGGRNLVNNGGAEEDILSGSVGTSRSSDEVYEGNYSYKMAIHRSFSKIMLSREGITFHKDQQYTFSFYYKNPTPNSGQVSLFSGPWNGDRTGWKNINANQDWTKVEHTFTATETGTYMTRLENHAFPESSDVFLYIDNIKIEKGNKATDWTPAPEDTDAKISHIETEWTQTFDSFSQTVVGIDGRVSSQEQTINGIQDIVYDPETGLSSLNTQLANLVQVAVTGDELSSQVSILENNINARVEKGELLTQINLEAGRTLIQSDRLLLNANNTVITGTAWLDGAVIKDASIDTAQIADLAVSSAKIASLDVDKISGNTAEFVRVNLNDINNSVQLTGSGLDMYRNDGTRNARIGVNGYEFWMDSSEHGFMGIRRNTDDNPAYLGRYSLSLHALNGSYVGLGYQGDNDRNFYSGYAALMVHGDTGQVDINTPLYIHDSIHFQPGSTSHRIWKTFDNTKLNIHGGRHLSLGGAGVTLMELNHWASTNTSSIHAYADLNMNTNAVESVSAIGFTGGSSNNRIWRNADNSTLFMRGARTLALGAGGVTLLEVTRFESSNTNIINVRTGINMNGNTITNQSDERLKTHIKDAEINSLNAIKSWRFVGYNWTDSEMNNRLGRQFGVIAQETPELAVYDAKSDTWSINSSKQIMMNSHAIQQLAIRELNTNKVASQALQASETNAQRIERLEQRIDELESVA